MLKKSLQKSSYRYNGFLPGWWLLVRCLVALQLLCCLSCGGFATTAWDFEETEVLRVLEETAEVVDTSAHRATLPHRRRAPHAFHLAYHMHCQCSAIGTTQSQFAVIRRVQRRFDTMMQLLRC